MAKYTSTSSASVRAPASSLQFRFLCHRFTPARDIPQDIRSDVPSASPLLMTCAISTEAGWDFDRFRKKCGDTPCSLYIMDGKYLVCPTPEGLYLYGKEADSLYTADMTFIRMCDNLLLVSSELTERIVLVIKSYLQTHGPQKLRTLDGIVLITHWQRGTVIEPVERVTLDKRGRLCVTTEDDTYIEGNPHADFLSLGFQLLPVFRRQMG